MDPIAQFLYSIPGLQGSLQEWNRNTLQVLQNTGQGDAPWIPDFIAQQKASGWL